MSVGLHSFVYECIVSSCNVYFIFIIIYIFRNKKKMSRNIQGILEIKEKCKFVENCFK